MAAEAAAAANEWCPCDTLCSVVSERPTDANSDSQCSQHASYPAGVMSKICWGDSMEGSVKSHSKHLLVAEGSDASKWAEEVTNVSGSFSEALEKALQEAKKAGTLSFKVRASLSDAPSLDEHGRPLGPEDSPAEDPHQALDLLLFPDQIRIKQVRKDLLPQFVAALAEYTEKQMANQARAAFGGAKCAPAAAATAAAAADDSAASSSASAAAPAAVVFPLPHVALPGTYFLICSHKLRDKRCGVTGPILVDEIERAMSTSYPSSAPPSPVHALKISHIGGHKFAGNLIAYPPGVWYGKVLPCHIPHILLAHCGPDFALVTVDPASGERVTVTAKDTNLEAERNKLKPLIRGYVDSAAPAGTINNGAGK